MELDGVDLGRDGDELADEELEHWGGSGGVVSSNLDLLGGTAESIIFFMVRRSSGTSVHSTSDTNKKNKQKGYHYSSSIQSKVPYSTVNTV